MSPSPPQKKSSTHNIEASIFILGFLIFGSLNTLCTKLQFTLTSIGLDGDHHPKPFSKPWFGSYRMFVAMFLVLIVYTVGGVVIGLMGRVWKKMIGSKSKSKNPDNSIEVQEGYTLIDDDGDNANANKTESDSTNLNVKSEDSQDDSAPLQLLPPMSLSQFLFLAVPAVFDLSASTCSFIGLLYISASIWQMLRGSMIIFNSILFVMFLKRKLVGYHWVGVGLCTCGIILVGGAGIMGSASSEADSSTDSSSSDFLSKIFGVSLVIFGQLIQAGQVVVEEKILKQSDDHDKGDSSSNEPSTPLPPAVVVGLEGLWGTLILSFIGFPLLYFVIPGNDYGNCQENLLDTLVMLKNSKDLQTVIGIYLVSCSMYNFCGMSITKYLNSVHRTMLDAWRTLLIWGASLTVLKTESWHGFWSYVQLSGFCLLIFGQLCYGGIVRLPGSIEQIVSSIGSVKSAKLNSQRNQKMMNSNTNKVTSSNLDSNSSLKKSLIEGPRPRRSSVTNTSNIVSIRNSYISPSSSLNLVPDLPIDLKDFEDSIVDNVDYEIVISETTQTQSQENAMHRAKKMGA